jgi:hypothetical protein
MFIDKLQLLTQKSKSFAMSLVSLGLFLVVLGTAFARFGAQSQAPAWQDFARGLFFGMGMALEAIGLLGMTNMARRRSRSA